MTAGGATDGRLELLARSLPAGYEIRLLVLEPGREVNYEASAWHDALVEVECGEVELLLRDDRRYRARVGDVLWLNGLGVLRLANPGTSPAALVSLTRTR